MNSALFFSYQPMQAMTNTHITAHISEMHELRIQLFFMRRNTEIIGLPCNGVGVGGGIMAVKRKRHQ